MYTREVAMVRDEEEEYIGIRGGQIHSPESLDPMEGVSILELLDTPQSFFA